MENFIEVGWSPHVVITFWVLIGSLVLLGLSVFIAEKFMLGAEFGSVIAAMFAGIMIIGMVIALIPFDGKYHHIYRVNGTVDSVSNIVTSDGGDLSRVPVVKLSSVEDSLVIEDPRAVDLKGREVDLTCTVEWVYQSADRYNCKIYDIH